MAREVKRYPTGDGRTIYALPLEVFPSFWGNAYLVTGGQGPVLVDCGSGQASSNHDLEAGFAAIAQRFGERIEFSDLRAILITHGHIDHFGGLNWVKRQCLVPVGIQVLDRRVLSHYPERVIVAAAQVERFLAGTGVSPERRRQYLQMYRFTKGFFQSVAVDFWFESGPLLDGEFIAVHVPGHCSGQVCLRCGQVLLTADHILPGITPHLSPEIITANTGVGHYLESLARISAMADVAVGLGGHQGPIRDLTARLQELRQALAERQERLLELCAEPRALAEISRRLFGPVRSYHILLALLETGAHVEYLYQRGELVATNLEEIESDPQPVIRYQRV